MTLKNRLAQLEKQTPTTDAARIALMKPSEILARVDELLTTARQRKAADPNTRYSSDGGNVFSSAEIARRIDALRWMVTHEQP